MRQFRIGRRGSLGLGLGGLISLLPAARGAFADTPDFANVTLRAATFKGQDETFLPLAGLRDTPYKLQYFEFNSGQLIVEAMNADALDLGGCSEIPLAFAAAADAQIRVVAVLKGDVNDQVVLVPKASAIKTIADLKSKRVGYVRATTSHYYLLRMLWDAGLSFRDIQAIPLSPSDGAAAFSSGDLDAWAIYGYAINFAMAQGNARILRTAEGILSGNYFIGVNPNALTDPGKRAAVADYLVRVGRGYQWLESHKAQWCAALAPVINVRLPFVQAEFYHESQAERVVPIDDAAIASAQEVLDTFVKAGLLPEKVDVSPFFDRSFAGDLRTI